MNRLRVYITLKEFRLENLELKKDKCQKNRFEKTLNTYLYKAQINKKNTQSVTIYILSLNSI